ncbi:hypothetical protein SDC9_40664 [bioreactor metagenome]|uniref:Uncharacterized protein n=1 Tax=bioreactor metagenome TaxID=1076179 RepID=A0A644VTG4_9ZZZZ
MTLTIFPIKNIIWKVSHTFSYISFKQLPRFIRKIGIDTQITAIVQCVSIKVIVGNQFADKFQSKLLHFRQCRIQKRSHFRWIIHFFQHPFRRMLDRCFAGPRGITISHSLLSIRSAGRENSSRNRHLQIPLLRFVNKELQIIPCQRT